MAVLFCRLFILGCITQLQCFRWCFKVHTDTQHLRPERSCTEFFKRLTGNQAWQAVPAKICSLWTGYGGGGKKKVSQYNVLKNQLPAFLIVCTQKLQNILQPYLPFIKTFNFSPKSLKWHAHHTDMQQIIELSLTSKKMMQILNMSIWSNVVTKFEHAVKQNASK